MATNEHSSGIGISPGILSGAITTSQSKTFTLTVDNMNGTSVTVTASGGSFAQDPNTLINYLVDAHSYDDWISFEEVTLAPNSQTNIQATVSVPAGTSLQKGSYYPALVLSFDVPAEEENTTIQLEHAVPIYLNIANTALTKVEVNKFSVQRFLFGSSIDLTAELTNVGTTHTKPSGYLELSQLSVLGAETSTRIGTLPINKKSVTLLPDSTFSETITWEQNSPGHYQSSLYIVSEEEDTLVRTVDFWIIPTQWVLIVTAVIAILFTAAILAFLRRRSRKNREKSPEKPPKSIGRFSFKLKK